MRILDIGTRHDPAIHLAIEEWCVRTVDPGNGILMTYVNDPCVVVGKNQNVYEEVDVAWTRRHGVPIHRRLSGGGTVVHDRGNLNLCWFRAHRPGTWLDVPAFLEPVRRALEGLGARVERNTRNDLLVDGRKVSGNAQFASVRAMLCHATLLYDADLDALRAALAVDAAGIRSRAPKSVRASVTNLRDHLGAVEDLDDLRTQLVARLASASGEPPEVLEPDDDAWRAIEDLARTKYRTWEWTFGRAPRFTVERAIRLAGSGLTFALEIERGVVASVRIPAGADRRRAGHVAACLTGVRYERDALTDALERAGLDAASDGVDAATLAARLHP